MPSNIGFKLNRLYETTYTNGDITMSFLAVRLESTQANALFIHGVDFYAIFPSAADRNSFVQHELLCIRGLELQNNVAIAGQIGRGDERVWGQSSSVSGQPVDFDAPMRLEPGYIYTFVLLPALFDPALAGTVRIGLTVRGEMLPWTREEKSPVELRTGTAEDAPNCVQISEA